MGEFLWLLFGCYDSLMEWVRIFIIVGLEGGLGNVLIFCVRWKVIFLLDFEIFIF